MAVLVVVDIPGGTKEQYEANHKKITGSPWFPPKGFVSHVAAPSEAGWLIVDVFETKDDYTAFVERAMPIFQENGTPPVHPKFYEPANFVAR
ncbi:MULTISPECIES: hypothetical protein [Streptomyces]|uniref:ABM domain-containing protein n=1 Tax=Streptomyces solicathayae TaxID=3081768 RepID=A0ABZ0LWD5_9ACTN|nr:hypothetical protein [Streptomyces sp. HUAS YS2]WOX23645.1 hypothetical protein R2D22_20560 [Streptomyces sp. HUAS YS2]